MSLLYIDFKIYKISTNFFQNLSKKVNDKVGGVRLLFLTLLQTSFFIKVYLKIMCVHIT